MSCAANVFGFQMSSASSPPIVGLIFLRSLSQTLYQKVFTEYCFLLFFFFLSSFTPLFKNGSGSDDVVGSASLCTDNIFAVWISSVDSFNGGTSLYLLGSPMYSYKTPLLYWGLGGFLECPWTQYSAMYEDHWTVLPFTVFCCHSGQ